MRGDFSSMHLADQHVGQSSAWDRIQRIAQEAQSTLRMQADVEASKPTTLFVPGMDQYMRAMPNYLSRSSLFAPVAWDKRKIHDGTVLFQSEKVTLKGWGKQLTEDLADIWMHALYLCSKAPLGHKVVVSRSRFLRAVGRNTSGYSYDWLHRGVIALSTFTIAIEARTKNGGTRYSIGNHPSSRLMHMLGGFDYSSKTDEYLLIIDPRWRMIFTNREYGLIDWIKRLQFGLHQNQAKSLQRLISTSSDVLQRHSLDFLKNRAQYNSPMRKFRKDALEPAMRELERLEIIAEGRIELSTKGNEQAVWIKL